MELRTVLTAEVAQRHDQLVALHDELKEHEQKQHETLMQLQLKNEIIKDLRREVKSMKHNFEAFDTVMLRLLIQKNTVAYLTTTYTSMMSVSIVVCITVLSLTEQYL